ncbi:MAG: hypothetical protein JJT76_13805 [Clostridiaceae bacterium]|nr:hypothetical protein [Clostridiaceae bacterium]
MPNNATDPYFPEFQPVCIIADKVYAHCQQRECFKEVQIELPKCTEMEFLDIKFNPGRIIRNSLVITPVENNPNFSRVRFKVVVTFIVRVKNTKTGTVIKIPGKLPEIHKDIIMYIPKARDEFSFEIVVETASRKLNEPIQEKGCLIFAAGVFLIIKVVGRVQLQIPEFGFCPDPPPCEEFIIPPVCDGFEEEDFPEFFPEQLDDKDYFRK